MYFSGTKKQKRLRMILDIINTVIGIAIIVLTIVAFNADDGYIVYFPYMFLLGGTMNLLAAIKNYTQRKIAVGITMSVTTVIFFVAGIVTLISIH